jgi:hypothetical protein
MGKAEFVSTCAGFLFLSIREDEGEEIPEYLTFYETNVYPALDPVLFALPAVLGKGSSSCFPRYSRSAIAHCYTMLPDLLIRMKGVTGRC